MIENFRIKNFKIHSDTSLDFAPLTILTGMNGAGKSSVIQLLLMLRESVVEDKYPKRLDLKGDSFEVGGSSASLINWNASGTEADVLNLGLKIDGGNNLVFKFRYPVYDSTDLKIVEESPIYDTVFLQQLSLFDDRLQYLSAFRHGPRRAFMADSRCDESRSVSRINGDGVMSVVMLERFGQMPIATNGMAADDNDIDLRLNHQTDLWLQRVSPNVRLNISNSAGEYRLNMSYPRSGGRSRTLVSPYNTGFGISYLLSVIVALLLTPKGGIVIIENPEAHIHPAAQSSLMELIAKAAGAGVQVIIETHSDHIIFGALVNMKKNLLEHSDLKIHHFDQDNDSGELIQHQITIGDDCRIKNPPANFVEQMNLDLDILFDD